MSSYLKNCIVCLNHNNLHKFGVFGKRKVADEMTNEDDRDESRCVDNQVQVIFLLIKMLQIPKTFCMKFFQEYGNPCSWIYCCSDCSILVDEARTVFDEIALLQKKFENCQVQMKNLINDSVKSQANTINTSSKTSPNEIVRAYVTKEYNAKTEIIEEIQDMPMKSESDFQDWSPVATSSDSENDEANDSCEPTAGTEITSNEEDNSSKYICKDVEDFIEDIKEIEDCDDGNYTCHICAVDFNVIKADFIRHKLIHIPGTKRYFECDICKRRFTQNRLLEMHYVIHSGRSPYVCKFCYEIFPDSENLKTHLRTHTGEMPYTCKLCHNTFKVGKGFKSHLRQHGESRAYSVLNLETVASSIVPGAGNK